MTNASWAGLVPSLSNERREIGAVSVSNGKSLRSVLIFIEKRRKPGLFPGFLLGFHEVYPMTEDFSYPKQST